LHNPLNSNKIRLSKEESTTIPKFGRGGLGNIISNKSLFFGYRLQERNVHCKIQSKCHLIKKQLFLNHAFVIFWNTFCATLLLWNIKVKTLICKT